MKVKIFSVFLLALSCLLADRCHAQDTEAERVLSFVSEITINEDSTMMVTEKIKVISSGKQIKRGIYRDFPTRYQDRYGNNFVVNFKVLKVLRNGATEDYRVENLNNGKRIYMGNKNVYLSPGEYSYVVTYKTDRQLGFFDKFDELYWNVTGNGWSFYIDEAKAVVSLPKDAGKKIIEGSGYTGRKGSREHALSVTRDGFGRIIFAATRPLAPYEGLTIVVAWPKGYVKEPSFNEKVGYILRDNLGGIAALFSLLILIVYYLVVWARVGKDPTKGTIIPLYEPPKGFSASSARFIMKMGFDDKTFTAAIIEIAVKGVIAIHEEGGKYILEKTNTDERLLSSQEFQVVRILFASGNRLELKSANHTVIKKAIDYLRSSLLKSYERIYFLTNRKYFISGALLSLALMFTSVVLQGIQSSHPEKIFIALFMSAWISIWTCGVVALLFTVVSLWRSAKQGVGVVAQALFLTFFSIPFIFGEIFGLGVLFYATSVFVFLALLTVIFTNILFYNLLKAPTFQGRKIMDKIEGFKMYLSTAEKNRLNVLNPPERTPELFEKYLPYALALDVEQQWAQNFSDVLERASSQPQGYKPSWYTGTLYGINSANFALSLSAGFSSAISSSATSPGSSSGSGGGVSSGSGGGGGGGGGW
ncbi:MAG: DUF2207 domain-containing protein [Candidatus Omnitrophota bacterium]